MTQLKLKVFLNLNVQIWCNWNFVSIGPPRVPGGSRWVACSPHNKGAAGRRGSANATGGIVGFELAIDGIQFYDFTNLVRHPYRYLSRQ